MSCNSSCRLGRPVGQRNCGKTAANRYGNPEGIHRGKNARKICKDIAAFASIASSLQQRVSLFCACQIKSGGRSYDVVFAHTDV